LIEHKHFKKIPLPRPSRDPPSGSVETNVWQRASFARDQFPCISLAVHIQGIGRRRIMNRSVLFNGHHHAVPSAAGTWLDFRQEFERLFDRFSDGIDSVALQPFTAMQRWFEPINGKFTPLAVDVAESENNYTITAELPGVAEDEVDVSVHDDMLVIAGEKQQEADQKSSNRYISERSYGAFRRIFSLPRGTDAEKIEANFRNGILKITVPKAAEKQESRKVEVKSA
jgi:HSP20 family protein